MKRVLLGMLLMLGMSSLPFTAAHANDKQGVVIQVSDNDPAKWNLTMNVVKNLQAAMKDVNIEVVVFGPGINMLKFDSEVANRLDQAKKDGVEVKACQNTMKAQKLTEKDMHPSVGYVPAGVVEIVQKQKQGWGYVSP